VREFKISSLLTLRGGKRKKEKGPSYFSDRRGRGGKVTCWGIKKRKGKEARSFSAKRGRGKEKEKVALVARRFLTKGGGKTAFRKEGRRDKRVFSSGAGGGGEEEK